MGRIVRFLPLARLDAAEASDWYRRRSERLGDLFIAEMDRSVRAIAENPLSFPIIYTDVRRARLRRFPYGLFYRPIDDTCFVFACFHASRDPKTWQERA